MSHGLGGRPAFRDVTNTSVLPPGVVKRGVAKPGPPPAPRPLGLAAVLADDSTGLAPAPVRAAPAPQPSSVFEVYIPPGACTWARRLADGAGTCTLPQRLQQQTTVSAAQKRKRPVGAPEPGPADLTKRRPSVEPSENVPPPTASPVPFMACAPRYVQAGMSSASRMAAPLAAPGPAAARLATPSQLLQRAPPTVLQAVPKSPRAAPPPPALVAAPVATPLMTLEALEAEKAALREQLVAVTSENAQLAATVQGLQQKTALQQSIIASFETEVTALENEVKETEAMRAGMERMQQALDASAVTADKHLTDLAMLQDQVALLTHATEEALKENEQVHTRTHGGRRPVWDLPRLTCVSVCVCARGGSLAAHVAAPTYRAAGRGRVGGHSLFAAVDGTRCRRGGGGPMVEDRAHPRRAADPRCTRSSVSKMQARRFRMPWLGGSGGRTRSCRPSAVPDGMCLHPHERANLWWHCHAAASRGGAHAGRRWW
jgi:hypothetical protein